MIRVNDLDVRELKNLENMLGSLNVVMGDNPSKTTERTKVVMRALNRTGDMARTRVVRALARQTGLSQKIIRKAVKVKKASWRDLEYVIRSKGGEVSLKYFKKRETDDGVRAWLGEGRGEDWFPESFFRGGRWPRPRRDAPKLRGHVFSRRGGRTDLELIKSGVFIGEEMITGASAQAFNEVTREVLPRRLEHEINRALGL